MVGLDVHKMKRSIQQTRYQAAKSYARTVCGALPGTHHVNLEDVSSVCFVR